MRFSHFISSSGLRSGKFISALNVLTIVLTVLAGTVLQAEAPDPRVSTTSIYGRLPVAFEANNGQLASNIRFMARGPSYDMYFAPQSMTLALRSPLPQHHNQLRGPAVKNGTIRIDLSNSNRSARMLGSDELPQKANYFIGSDPGKWQTRIRTYARVKYQNVYPGTDLVFYGKGGKIEYDFVLKPGARPENISLAIHGPQAVRVGHDGSLAMRTNEGTVRFRKPVLYQENGQGRKYVDGRFVVRATGPRSGHHFLVSFQIANYDHANALVIDPVLDYSTYLGGSGSDFASAIARDPAGNTYIVGTARSLDFPVTAGIRQAKCAGSICEDVFVAKLNPTGSGLVYATYLGGSQSDFGVAIAADSNGNAYITGATQSTDFPTTVGALKRTCGGTCVREDAFVAKLNPTGSGLFYSTYLGGDGEDFGSGIRVLNGNAFVAGFSGSTDFPTTASAYKAQMEGQGSSFVVKLNSTGKALIYGTFLGEVDLQDAGPSISLDSTGNSYLVGDTISAKYPVTAGAFRTPFQGILNSNLYITKLNSTGSALVFSALIGGAGASSGGAIDASGNVYFATSAGNFFPVTPNAVEQSCTDFIINGSSGGILIGKLSADGTQLLASGHVCPNRAWPTPVGFDAAGNLIAAGYTDSAVLPTTVNGFQRSLRNICCFSDGFIMRLTPDASAVTYSTYFGGNSSDFISGFITDSARDLFLTGSTSSTNLPVSNAFQPSLAGSSNAFISRMTLPITKLSVFPSALSFSSQGIGILSSPLEVVLANVSSASIPISTISATGDFTATTNCGTELPSASRCIISASFKPTTTGKRTGILTITDSLGSQRVTLSGVGVDGPVVKFTPIPPINNQPFGTTSPPFTVTVTNTGNKTLVISRVGLDNGPLFNFSGPITCFTPLPPLSSCAVRLIFTPGSAFSQYFATLTLTDNTKTGSDITGLVGNSIDPVIAFASAGARFNQQQVGVKSGTQQIAFVNGSGAPITISGFKVSPNFTQTHTCGATLAAGAFCYVNVAFKPTTTGILQGSVTITDNGPGSPHVLPLIGTGK